MGEYFICANLSKREYLHFCPAKLREWAYNNCTRLFPSLLAGRWKGDRIAMIGDQSAFDRDMWALVHDTYTDITQEIVEDWNADENDPHFHIER